MGPGNVIIQKYNLWNLLFIKEEQWELPAGKENYRCSVTFNLKVVLHT